MHTVQQPASAHRKRHVLVTLITARGARFSTRSEAHAVVTFMAVATARLAGVAPCLVIVAA
eukprot:520498-Prymnesium_polylepis.1